MDRILLLIAGLLAAGCSSSLNDSITPDGTAGFASGDPATDSVPAFTIYTPDRFCLGDYSTTAFATWCGETSALFAWDADGTIRGESGLCLSAQTRVFDGDGNLTNTYDLTPFDLNPAHFYPCDGGADQQWSRTLGQIWMPLPDGGPGVACLEFQQQSLGGGLAFTDVATDLSDCIIGQEWKLSAPPPAAGPVPHVCTAELNVQNQWEGGFVAELAVTLVDPGVDEWTMDWTFGPVAPTITSMWNVGSWAQSGDDVFATDAGWNGNVGINETVTIGFTASGAPPDPAFLSFFFNELDCLNPSAANLNGPPAFPVWTGGTDPVCLVGDGNDMNVGDCDNALPFRWLNGALETEDGMCMQDSSLGPQLWPCTGAFPQAWSRTGDGALYTGNANVGYSCLVVGAGGLDSIPVSTLDGCDAWNQGGPPLGDGGALCEGEVVATNQWPGGFQAEATFTWNGAPLDNWLAEWTFTNDEQLGSLWNGVGWQVGADVYVANEAWNGSMEPGDSVTVGFVGVGEFAPVSDLSFSGVACQ